MSLIVLTSLTNEYVEPLKLYCDYIEQTRTQVQPLSNCRLVSSFRMVKTSTKFKRHCTISLTRIFPFAVWLKFRLLESLIGC